MSVNKVILVGNLGADPELKYTPSNKAVCNLSVATNEVYKDKGGVRQEKTEWHRVTVWGETAENAAKYLGKGSKVYVEGKLQTRSFEKDGVTKYTTEVVAERVVFLDTKGKAEGGSERGKRREGWGGNGGGGDQRAPGEDDIPI